MALRRLVWWKVVLWAAIGGLAGWAFAAWRPEPSAPSGVARVTAERFVIALAPAGPALDSATDAASNAASRVVVYPAHDGVRLLTFDLTDDGKTAPAYAYAKTPLLSGRALRAKVAEARRRLLFGGRAPDDALPLRLLPAADRAATAAEARPKQTWADAAEFLEATRVARPGFTYASAWWAEPWWRYGVPVAATATLSAAAAAVLTRRSKADQAAVDLLRDTVVVPAAGPTPSAGKDLRDVEALDALLAEKVDVDATSSVDDTHVGDFTPATPAAVVKLNAGPLERAAEAEREKKDFAGEFYPTERRKGAANDE